MSKTRSENEFAADRIRLSLDCLHNIAERYHITASSDEKEVYAKRTVAASVITKDLDWQTRVCYLKSIGA